LLLQHCLIERARGKRFADAPERHELADAEAGRTQEVVVRGENAR
jgi:hypothetical protein